MNLTEHFTLEELTRSETAIQRGIDNTPSGEVIVNLTKLAVMLEKVRAQLGGKPIHISSGYRSPALNVAVGGVPTSHHCFGAAADIEVPEYGTPLQVCRAIVASGIAFGQIIHEYGSWCHISIMPVPKPENRIITIDKYGDHVGLQEVRH